MGDIDLDILKNKGGAGGEGSWRLLTKKEILHGLDWKVKHFKPSYSIWEEGSTTKRTRKEELYS